MKSNAGLIGERDVLLCRLLTGGTNAENKNSIEGRSDEHREGHGGSGAG